MTDERFAELVARLESEAQTSPRGYRLRVALLAALGYGYILGVLAILFAALGGVVWAFLQGSSGRVALRRIGTAVGILIFTIGRALWVRFERPEGKELARDDAPVLFDEIEKIRHHMRAPRVHRVILERDVNAAVHQHPRLGMLGWQENSLFVGLPLLQALSPEQARSVLAHEFGHLSGAHSRFGGWIARVQSSWTRLVAQLEEDDHWSSFVFRPFFRWYSPYFSAYTFALRRQNEYEADAAGAELSSARVSGDALVSVNLKDTFLDHRFWTWVGRQAEVRPEPDVTPFRRMASLLPQAPDTADAENWLPQYLDFETNLADTHPSLRDRLAALGVEPRIPEPVEESAAAAWLGESHARLAAEFDEEWRAAQAEGWARFYAEVKEKEERIVALADKAAREELDADELWERACLVEERREAEEALPLYTAYAEKHPDHARARFHAGRMLLEAGDAEGIAHLEAAMEQADDAIVPGCDRIAHFLADRDDAQGADRYAERRDAHQAHLDAVEHERDFLPKDIEYLPHDVDAEQLAPLVEDLSAIEGVKQAWLMRKPLELSDEPLYILAVIRRRATWNPLTWDEWQKDPAKDEFALQQQIAQNARCPGDTRIIVLNHRERDVRALWTSNPDCQIVS